MSFVFPDKQIAPQLHEPSCALTALCQCAFPQEACGLWSNVTRDGPCQNARWNIGKHCLAKGWNIQGIHTNKWHLERLKKVVTHTQQQCDVYTLIPCQRCLCYRSGCNHSRQCRNSVSMLCCAKNCCCQLSCVKSS